MNLKSDLGTANFQILQDLAAQVGLHATPNSMNEMVILVDPHDRQIGVEEKMKAHREGKLHRAFSVFVFNEKGEMLLQKRAPQKYHSGGLWTNACCSHPRPGEAIEQAALRRLEEEMGFACQLKKAFHFIYKAELDAGLIEHEFDHVFVGNYNGQVCPNIDEVADYRWVNIDALNSDLDLVLEKYTIWFKIALRRALKFAATHKLLHASFQYLQDDAGNYDPDIG
ncbi:MAG: isopentenyl-diphosphate Delta-isomerase [bacterium]